MMSKPPPPTVEEDGEMWTTWEELLLTCAVKRHGLKDWESVAMELQNRSSHPLVLTAQICRNKYHDLKRRFIDDRSGAPTASADDVDSIPWLEELRKLRVAELKQEVHRHDLSIQSLQLKVKRLEEERERNENNDEKPDLENDKENERSDTDKTASKLAPAEELPENVTGKSVSGEYSDRDSRTFKESNSAENREKTDGAEPEPVQTGPVKQDPDGKPVGEDSCNDSSDTVAKQAASKPSQVKKTEDDSNELRNSAAESKERTKDSSDVQSSASLTKKIRRRVEVTVGEQVGSPATTIKRESEKSEPLVEFLDIFRSHKHGSMFERRLDIQKTDNYKNTIRQHVDLETVQTRIEDGSYSSCPTKFYSDLLLLFNNATVFFPKDSDESAAAIELRNLVLKEIKKKRIGRKQNRSPESKSEPKPDPEKGKPESLLAKHKSSVPIIVCGKRSSISTKPKPATSSKQPDNKLVTKPDNKPAIKPDNKVDHKPLSNSKQPVKGSSNNTNEEDLEGSIKMKAKEKPVTGVRSMRRSSNSNRTSNTTSSKGHASNPVASGKAEAAAKGEKKKAEAAKKSGVADFLKRIKRNSPAKGSAEEGGGGRREQKKRVEEKKEVPPPVKKKGGGGGGSGGGGGKQVREDSSPSKRNVGRPPKRGAEAVVPAKRGREVEGGGGGGGGGEGEGGSNSKRPKKRTRR